jgi:DNA-directed RNA polymerase specialized sigma24 family protein
MSQAAERLFREHHAQLLAYMTRVVGSHDAADVVQLVYLRILQGASPKSGSPTWPWLRRVALNAAFDMKRKEARGQRLSVLHDVEGDPIDETVADRLVVQQAMTRLSEAERTALIAFADGADGEHLASVLGRSKRAAYCLSHRARARARFLIESAMLPVLGWIAATRSKLRTSGTSNASNMIVQSASSLVAVVTVAAAGMFAGSTPGHPSDLGNETLATAPLTASSGAGRDANPTHGVSAASAAAPQAVAEAEESQPVVFDMGIENESHDTSLTPKHFKIAPSVTVGDKTYPLGHVKTGQKCGDPEEAGMPTAHRELTGKGVFCAEE